MKHAFEISGLNLGVVLGLMFALWLLSLLRKDASIVDPFWGAGFVVIAWVTSMLVESQSDRSWLLVALTTIWGLRLTGFLLWRNLGKPEDYRYAEMRQKHGQRFPIVSLMTVFMLQGVLMWLVSWPVQFGQMSVAASFGLLDAAGVVLWATGMLFETVGDYQLSRFKSDPSNRGQVLDTGFWRYTRHPNYFGDFCVWWGLYLIAASAGVWWTVVGPLLMSYLLLRFSGVSLLESTIVDRRPSYRSYIERTNAFFPGPPKREK